MEKTFKDLKIKEWNYKPLTIGLWRPYQVEVGFIEDYIKRWGTDKIILL
jgi:hypothetical protein